MGGGQDVDPGGGGGGREAIAPCALRAGWLPPVPCVVWTGASGGVEGRGFGGALCVLLPVCVWGGGHTGPGGGGSVMNGVRWTVGAGAGRWRPDGGAGFAGGFSLPSAPPFPRSTVPPPGPRWALCQALHWHAPREGEGAGTGRAPGPPAGAAVSVTCCGRRRDVRGRRRRWSRQRVGQ